ncbi:MAG TPA: HYR domain-containing protein, partial [Cryomorphaceae bacterium]|nr:HYR domain-containing protein [Cryomorphaceae bacterium]
DCSNAGPNAVTLTVEDIAGNQASCVATVTVEDNIDPSITAPADVTASADATLCSASGVVLGSASASDNCGVDNVSDDAPATFPVGTTTVTYTAVDAAGNSSFDTQTVTVTDDEAPFVNCQDIVAELDANGIAIITADQLDNGSTDNCGIASLSLSNNQFDCTNLGINQVTLSVTDIHGNTASCIAAVDVQDNQAPTIICNTPLDVSNIGGECGAFVTYSVPTATDNCEVDVITQIGGLGSGALFPIGVTTEIYQVTDPAGNLSTCSFTISISDVEAPVANCTNATVQLDETGNGSLLPQDIDNNSSDNCEIISFDLSQSTFTTADIGLVNVLFTVTDAAGNSDNCFADVTVLPFECTVDGGTISTQDERLNLCLGDGQDNFIQVSISGNVGLGRFGLINSSTNQVVFSNFSGVFNMENFPAGTYNIVHASVASPSQYQGVQSISDLEGCFDISNAIGVSSFLLNAGTITTDGPTTICNDDGVPSVLTFDVNDDVGINSRWAVLNEEGTNLLANNSTGTFNFELASVGVYRVIHASWGDFPGGQISISNPTGCVQFSDPIFITVESCTAALPTLSSNPNPTAGMSHVQFSVPESMAVLLDVYDLSGRHVKTIHNANALEGQTYRYDFDGTVLPNGVYIYRMTAGSEVIINKFMIAR